LGSGFSGSWSSMQAVKSSGEAEQILEQLVLHAAGARLTPSTLICLVISL